MKKAPMYVGAFLYTIKWIIIAIRLLRLYKVELQLCTVEIYYQLNLIEHSEHHFWMLGLLNN